mmetsp:Transcript_38370/g.67346  ORF Transcript_38370/g.67346 Transcript_38370/m.67346 type:complete len:179 (-) Transcript_38370:610-1146(-)
MRRRSSHAASSTAMPLAEATEESSSLSTNDNSNNNSSNNYNSKIMISSLHHLKRYRTNKDAETAIVRLGRKGRTDEALQLYHAIWTLDGLKQQYKIKQQQQQKEDSSQQTTPIQLQLTNGHEPPPSTVMDRRNPGERYRQMCSRSVLSWRAVRGIGMWRRRWSCCWCWRRGRGIRMWR